LTAIQQSKGIMASGKVKWFDNKRGFGFILQETGQDVFVHHTCIEGEGFRTLNKGDLVNYELIPGERGPKAARVKRVLQRSQF
jgi:CspA family cold shock protein